MSSTSTHTYKNSIIQKASILLKLIFNQIFRMISFFTLYNVTNWSRLNKLLQLALKMFETFLPQLMENGIIGT